MSRVVVLGSLNVDLITSVQRHPQPGETVTGTGLARVAGGKGANQAVAAARWGSEVVMLGCVGDDSAGAAYRDRLARLGIDVSGLVVAEGPSGHALIAVDEEGENSIVVIPGANAAAGLALPGLARLLPGDVLLLQLEVPVEVVSEAVRIARMADAMVILNVAPYAALPPDVLAEVDLVVANEHEAGLLAESGALPQSLLVTFGAHGASWDGMSVDAHPAVAVVDTTGAGDAFCGALAAALARGAAREDALQAALAAGADAVGYAGAQPDGAL